MHFEVRHKVGPETGYKEVFGVCYGIDRLWCSMSSSLWSISSSFGKDYKVEF